MVYLLDKDKENTDPTVLVIRTKKILTILYLLDKDKQNTDPTVLIR